MHLGLGLHQGLVVRADQIQEPRLEQALECTLQLRQTLQDPFEYARELFENSPKVNVPIKVGRYTINVKAAIVPEDELGRLFEDERFAGIMARFDERFQFFNQTLRAPLEIAPALPRLMAFHCLSSIKVDRFGDDTGTLSQFQAIALELAYARSFMPHDKYSSYEIWRPTVERSRFFQRSDWQEIAGLTYKRFKEIIEDVHANAHHLGFLVTMKGERLALTPDGAVDLFGERVPITRKLTSGRKR